MAYKKILVGVDSTETSLRAARYAAQLAKAESADLLIMHAHVGADDPEAVLERAAAAAGEEGVAGETRAVKGEAARAILDLARSEGCDLIVVGNQGMEGVRRLLGSVPNAVSHRAPCDLLIVRTV